MVASCRVICDNSQHADHEPDIRSAAANHPRQWVAATEDRTRYRGTAGESFQVRPGDELPAARRCRQIGNVLRADADANCQDTDHEEPERVTDGQRVQEDIHQTGSG